MNLQKAASGLRISFDQTAGSLPRVLFTLSLSKPPRLQDGSTVGMLSGLVLKLDAIWETMLETLSK